MLISIFIGFYIIDYSYVLVVESAGPGPGAYQTVQEFFINDKPAFSFRKRIYVKERSEGKFNIIYISILVYLTK